MTAMPRSRPSCALAVHRDQPALELASHVARGPFPEHAQGECGTEQRQEPGTAGSRGALREVPEQGDTAHADDHGDVNDLSSSIALMMPVHVLRVYSRHLRTERAPCYFIRRESGQLQK